MSFSLQNHVELHYVTYACVAQLCREELGWQNSMLTHYQDLTDRWNLEMVVPHWSTSLSIAFFHAHVHEEGTRTFCITRTLNGQIHPKITESKHFKQTYCHCGIVAGEYHWGSNFAKLLHDYLSDHCLFKSAKFLGLVFLNSPLVFIIRVTFFLHLEN